MTLPLLLAAGVLVVILLRYLMRYERESVASLGEAVVAAEEEIRALRRRVEALEAIATASESVPRPLVEGDGRSDTSGVSSAGPSKERRTRA